MIGCIARATSYEVLLNPTEMEDVQVGVWGGGRVCVGGFGGVPGVRGGCTGGGGGGWTEVIQTEGKWWVVGVGELLRHPQG